MESEPYNDESSQLLNEEKKQPLSLTTKIIAIAFLIMVLASIAVSLALAYQIGKFNNINTRSSSYEIVCIFILK